MIVDGKAIAEEVYTELEMRRGRFAAAPRLGIVVGGSDPVIESFVRIKTRAAVRLQIEIIRADLPAAADTRVTIAELGKLSARVDGLIVQLPLPYGIDADAVIAAIPPGKDIDAISPHSDDRVVAPVAGAVEEILARSNVELIGARAVVVGAGRLVGAPVAALLKKHGAQVSIVTHEHGSLDELKEADIVVLGAGDPAFVKPAMLKQGVALIDAGTSESAGKVRGDADPSCADVASVFTPVPGGVGPVAVAMIFRNLFDLMEGNS